MNDTNLVQLEIDEYGVASVSLNRPEVNNAYNAGLVQALTETFETIARDASVRAVVIRGNGPHFQAGADLNWLREVGEMDEQRNLDTSYDTANLIKQLDEFPVPTIALVHGACIGGGTGIVCACDIVVASEDAVFSISEARWGAIASIIFPQLNAAIGVRNVRRFALTCERFGAQKALQIGLVHEVVEVGGLEAAVKPIIASILQNGPKAVSASKHWCRAAGEKLTDELFDTLVNVHAQCRQSEEAHEGFTSFLEKRAARWSSEPSES